MPYVIKDWNQHYENAQSRKVQEAGWVPIPNKHDGKGFRRIASYDKRCEIFTAWILMLQLASKMPVRGVLADEDGDLTPADMSVKTGFPEHIFEIALNALSDTKIGWIMKIGKDGLVERYQSDTSPLGKSVVEGKGTEQKGTEEHRQRLFDLWNHYAQEAKKNFPHLPGLVSAIELGEDRISKSSKRLSERPLEKWEEVFSLCARTPFLNGESKEGWRASFDWIIANKGNAGKVLEGKYGLLQHNDGQRLPTVEEVFGG